MMWRCRNIKHYCIIHEKYIIFNISKGLQVFLIYEYYCLSIFIFLYLVFVVHYKMLRTLMMWRCRNIKHYCIITIKFSETLEIATYSTSDALIIEHQGDSTLRLVIVHMWSHYAKLLQSSHDVPWCYIMMPISTSSHSCKVHIVKPPKLTTSLSWPSS